jgi:uncharacterized membrane protein YkoI
MIASARGDLVLDRGRRVTSQREAPMLTRRAWCFACGIALALWFTSAASAGGQDKKDKLDLDKIPQKVMDTLKAKFPKAEIHKWTMEKEGDKVVYDIEFKQGTQKFEADIFEDGTLHNWEKEIAAKDVPEAVKAAVDKKYPKATWKEIMQITEVKDKKEVLEGYEIVLETADKKEVEVTVAPDGKILEDSTDIKKDKK